MSNVVKLAWVACLLAVAAVSSCNARPDGSEAWPSLRGCFTDDQCGSAGDKCVFRICSPACAADRSCDSGAQCVETGRGLACIRTQDNACLDGKDCPQSSECVLGRCTNLCEPDAGQLCQPAVEPVVSAGKGGAEAGSGGTGGTRMCAARSSQCRDNVAVRCDEDGRVQAEESCPFACRDGACTGSCRPGDVRCSGLMRERCDDSGAWIPGETCRNLCTAGACTNTCTDGARECDGNNVTLCRAGRQSVIQRCEYLCMAGACAGACTPGTRQCRGNAAVTCSQDGAWSSPAECANACVDGVCTGECAPGSQRCGSNTSYQLCSDRGQWFGNLECRDQACSQGDCIGVCTPGVTRCDSETALATCGSNGEWSGPTECAGQACDDGACAGSCGPATRRCSPLDAFQPQLCSAQGAWRDEPRCLPEQPCVEGACIGECIPGSRRCDLGNPARSYQLCGDASQWGAPIACGDAMRCTGGGICETTQTCALGQAPEWYGMGGGVNRSLYDPRWGGPLDSFESALGGTTTGYGVVFDRAANELAVTLRVTGGDDPTPEDFVYFAITSVDGTHGRAARVALPPGMGMGMGMDPRTLAGVEGYLLRDGLWLEEPGRPAWLQHASGWISTPDIAWAVSFRVRLFDAGIGSANSIRLALGVHAASDDEEDRQWTTPAQLQISTPLTAQPQSWPVSNLAELGCVARVVLP